MQPLEQLLVAVSPVRGSHGLIGTQEKLGFFTKEKCLMPCISLKFKTMASIEETAAPFVSL